MLLAIDVGNTNIVIGVFRGETLVHSWRLTTIRERTSDELGILISNLCERNEIRQTDISGIVIASVVPPLTGTLMTMVSDYFGRVPLLFEPAVNGGMPILIDNPHEVGADRVANSIAAFATYGKGLPLIVVDFGTATTFDAVSAKGEYLGGVICPGPTLSAEALVSTRRETAAHRREETAARDRHQHDRRDAVGVVLGLRGHGRRPAAPHEGGARRRRHGGRHRRPGVGRGAGVQR